MHTYIQTTKINVPCFVQLMNCVRLRFKMVYWFGRVYGRASECAAHTQTHTREKEARGMAAAASSAEEEEEGKGTTTRDYTQTYAHMYPSNDLSEALIVPFGIMNTQLHTISLHTYELTSCVAASRWRPHRAHRALVIECDRLWAD